MASNSCLPSSTDAKQDSVLQSHGIHSSRHSVDRAKVENLLKRRFFYAPAFEIYGGVAGLYDFGPTGCSVESNLLQIWRQMFIIEDEMLEVRCTQLTPYQILKTSGHVDRFADSMVKDVKTGECFRADHLIKNFVESKLSNSKQKLAPELCSRYEEILQNLDNYSSDELDAIIKEILVKSPTTGNDLTEASMFNLMFSTTIGPSSGSAGFLRPETAQGIFLNFKRLMDFNNGTLPFASAQIGCSFRNEISPRSGLLRVREFMMAEIEHFVDPQMKDSTRFCSVSDLELNMWSAETQLAPSPNNVPIRMSLDQAIAQNVIKNTTVGYYLGKIARFMQEIGIDVVSCMRFRQHLPKEMAHYAADCWDCELLTSYGWIECVGCADRSCYDLLQHSQFTREKLVASRKLKSPVTIKRKVMRLDKGKLGREYKGKAAKIMEAVASFSDDQVVTVESEIEKAGCFNVLTRNSSDAEEIIQVPKEMVFSISEETETKYVDEFVPHVIEPSFGIGRIMYALFEHSFRSRPKDEKMTWFQFPAKIAPLKCVILPLSANPLFDPFVATIAQKLGKLGVAYKVDDFSGSIGKRYARNDEIGVPFAITVDFDTVNFDAHSVTVRERDSCTQIRVSIDEAVTSVKRLVDGELTWQDSIQTYGAFSGQITITSTEN